jgi:hypothetical protein
MLIAQQSGVQSLTIIFVVITGGPGNIFLDL